MVDTSDPLSQQPGFELQHNFMIDDNASAANSAALLQHVNWLSTAKGQLYREQGVDWIHSGIYPLSQLPGFELHLMFNPPSQMPTHLPAFQMPTYSPVHKSLGGRLVPKI